MSITLVGTDGLATYGTTAGVTVPATAQANDLIVIYAAATRWPSIVAPGTFTLVHKELSGTGTSLESQLALFTGVVGTDCAASDVIAVGDASGGSENRGAVLACLRSSTGDVPSHEPSGSTGFNVLADPGNTSPTAPSITLSADGILLFATNVSQSSSGNSHTPPSGYTEHEDVNRAGIGLTLASKTASAGTSGTASSTASISGAWVASHLHVYDGSAGGAETTVSAKVSTGNDDAEEATEDAAKSRGDIDLGSSDIEIGTNDDTGSGSVHTQLTALRFNNVAIAQGNTVADAYVQFTAEETAGSTGFVARLWAEDTDDAAAIDATAFGLSSRTRTTAFVDWTPPAWGTIGERGVGQRTADISSLIQEVVNRSGWLSGNSIIVFAETSPNDPSSAVPRRVAESYEGSSSGAAELFVTHAEGTPDTTDPTVTMTTIHGPGEAESVHSAGGYDAVADTLTVSGTASDETSLDHVEVRVDSGSWVTATGTATWSLDLDVSGWSAGTYLIEARAVDAAANTSTVASETVWHSPDGVWGWSGVGQHLTPLSVSGYTP